MTSSTGRVPVRVEDVYTDSEDEGTRDSQPQGGLRLSFKEITISFTGIWNIANCEETILFI